MIVIVSLLVFFFAGGSDSLEELDLGRSAAVDSLELFSFHATVPLAVYSATVRVLSRAVANREQTAHPHPHPRHHHHHHMELRRRRWATEGSLSLLLLLTHTVY